MANGNQKTNVNNNGTTENVGEQQVQQQVEQTNVQQQPQQVQVVQVEQKEGVGAWLKRHWKGVVAGIVGTGATVGSAVIAYKKGKAAGIMSVPAPNQDEDYSLNPNE